MAYTTSCMHMAPLLALSTFLLLASMCVVGSAEEAPSIYHFELIHVEANNGSFTKDELVPCPDPEHRATTYLDTVQYNRTEYIMKLEIGTPPKTFFAIVDTGSDLIWTKRMELCDKEASSSFASMVCPRDGRPPDNEYCNECKKGGQCSFRKIYGSKKVEAEGFMADELLTLSGRAGGKEVKVCRHPIAFGCANKCHDDKGDADCHRLIPHPADGIVGLNWGPKSLQAQLGVSKFSYCISNPLKPEQSSPLWFGGGNLELSRRPWYWPFSGSTVQTTELVKTSYEPPSVWAYRYYIELVGISVGEGPVGNLPEGKDFKYKRDGGKGVLMVVDSGCTYSHLEGAAFDVLVDLLPKDLKDEMFQEKMANKMHSRTCFRADRSRPDIVLHFDGGAKMRLPWSTYMLEPKPGKSEFCMAIIDSGQNISILGNFQQQNIHILYDLEGRKLSFVPVADCSKAQVLN